MAPAFSYLHQSDDCLLDSSVVFPSFPIDISEFLEVLNNSGTSQNCCSHENSNSQQQLAVNVSTVQESSNSNESTITNKSSSTILEMESSAVMITNRMEISKESVAPIDRNRTNREGPSSRSFSQSENIREADNGKNLRKSKDQLTKEVKEKKGKWEDKKEAPTGYISVRAKRGQATDSHSLAERVRREKISERMKILQSLVPGCDKVISGKAQMLDEIINYIQSLENQVELLSMKLASLDPMYYDFGLDLDAITVSNDQQYCNPNDTNGGYPVLDCLTSQQTHIPHSISQVDGQIFSGVDDQRQMLFDQSGFSYNLCSFH